MKRIILIGLLMVLATGFHSCTEDEFLEPTTVDLKIKMVNTKPFDNIPVQGVTPSMEFSEGSFQITGLEFDGKRENNDDYYFFREFDNLVADLSDNSLNQEITFDIPRGSYKPIKITLHTNRPDSLPGLQLKGKWKRQMNRPGPGNQGPEEIPVEFNFFQDSDEAPLNPFTLKNEAGDQQIVFDGDNWNTLEIRINLAELFSQDIGDILDGAKIQGQGNKQKIIISPDYNEGIHSSLEYRVERSIKAVIK
ncbi:MAG: hypothetical protein V5A47_10795 [Bacteroidales bacterium]|nr:hypothetical protein [Bacteroidales bacterium]